MPSRDPATKIFDTEIFPVLNSPAFRRTCSRLAHQLTTAADADDFVQEASLRAWAARASFRSGGNAAAWCYRIATNYAINELTRRKRERKNLAIAAHDRSLAGTTYRGPGIPNGVTMDTSAPIEDQLDAETEWREVESDLDQISPNHRDALVGQYFLDEDYTETAGRLGCARNTILGHRFRGLAALRAVA